MNRTKLYRVNVPERKLQDGTVLPAMERFERSDFGPDGARVFAAVYYRKIFGHLMSPDAIDPLMSTLHVAKVEEA